MGVHVEWMNAGVTRPIVAPEGDEMPDGQNITGEVGLVFDENECVVIEGSYAEVRKLIEVAGRSLNAASHESLTSLVNAAHKAAEGDSNDDEIEKLQSALDAALTLLGREDLRA